MKKALCSGLIFVGILVIIMSVPVGFAVAQQQTCKLAASITKTAKKHHFSPRPVDDHFAKLVIDGFFNLLDPDRIFLTHKDRNYLREKYGQQLDELILEEDCSFINEATDLYVKRIDFVDSLLKAFSPKAFTFDVSDTLNTSDAIIATDIKELSAYWKKLIKLQALNFYYRKTDKTSKEAEMSAARMDSCLRQAIQRQQCRITAITTYHHDSEDYAHHCYLKAIASGFDPHTGFFTRDEQEAFYGSLSKTRKSFGIQFSRNDLGEMEITAIIPGSPAWNSNLMNEGDVILEVLSNGLTKDLSCSSPSELATLLASSELSTAVFRIRKKSGKEIVVPLRKAKTAVQENVISSFVLRGKEDVGYIYLPSFYSQMENLYSTTEGCANDVATELIKLKREGISGLIIDLRDNGGGSMMEAILLAGIFIDYGAVSIIKSRDEEPVSLRDRNRGTLYMDPVIVLINEFSASASELFAAAMQDQHCAVVVGMPSTGKATMQVMMPADAWKYDKMEDMPDDATAFLKITSGAFFRVTGESHQKTGVYPDIILPSLYDSLEIGESSHEAALHAVPIDKKTYYFPLSKKPVEKLLELSQKRLETDSAFMRVRELSAKMPDYINGHSIPLQFDAFGKYQARQEHFPMPEREAAFAVENPSYLKGISSVVNTGEEINRRKMDVISNDIYLNETWNIMMDLITLTKK